MQLQINASDFIHLQVGGGFALFECVNVEFVVNCVDAGGDGCGRGACAWPPQDSALWRLNAAGPVAWAGDAFVQRIEVAVAGSLSSAQGD